ncbi:MAG: hypothetical protein ABSB34_07725 [Candidatus Limnocylindrales bacterium]|jgi:hypothetical protein
MTAKKRRALVTGIPRQGSLDDEPTVAGAAHRAIHREFPDADERDYEWGMAWRSGETWSPPAQVAVARVRALRKARLEAANLSVDAWRVYLDEVTPRLSEDDKVDAEAIVGAVRQRIEVAIEVRRLGPQATERWEHGLTVRMIREAMAQERPWGCRQAQVAGRLRVSVSTLQRAVKDLDMGPWRRACRED